MTPQERCRDLVLLLAEVDQRIAAALEVAIDPDLPCEERTFAAEQLAYRRDTAVRIERLLVKLEGRGRNESIGQ